VLRLYFLPKRDEAVALKGGKKKKNTKKEKVSLGKIRIIISTSGVMPMNFFLSFSPFFYFF